MLLHLVVGLLSPVMPMTPPVMGMTGGVRLDDGCSIQGRTCAGVDGLVSGLIEVEMRVSRSYVSRAAAIRGAARGKVAVLDLGAGASQTASVYPTLAELCDGRVVDGVETVLLLIGEASKPGNPQAVARVRKAFPGVRAVFVRSFKSGSDFSAFGGCSDLPSVDFDAVPVAVPEWLSNHDLELDPGNGEPSRPALADLVMKPAPGYGAIGRYLGWLLSRLAAQGPIRDLLGWFPEPGPCPIGTSLVLRRGPMTDAYLRAHDDACASLHDIMHMPAPAPAAVRGWISEAGRIALDYARARDVMEAERTSVAVCAKARKGS